MKACWLFVVKRMRFNWKRSVPRGSLRRKFTIRL